MIVHSKGVFALSSRRNDITKSVRSILVQELKPIIIDKKGLTGGGLESLGNFREGICVKLVKSDD